MAGRGAGRGAGRNVIKGQLKDLSDRMEAVEGRLDRVETTLEFSESYRRVRIEHSQGLADLWTRIDSREVPGSRIKDEAAKIIEDEVKSQLSKEVAEDQLQAKSQELSRGKRSIPTHDARKTLAQIFTIRPYLEWISRDRAGAFQLVLVRGEPTRLLSESIKQSINWILFTMARMEGEAPRGIQMYMDRGPKARAKGKGKGKGEKGRGKGGKGRGKDGADRRRDD